MDSPTDDQINDSDTILNEIMRERDMKDDPAVSIDMLNLWENTGMEGRYIFEGLFFMFTGVGFQEYLSRCIRETTRSRTMENDYYDDENDYYDDEEQSI